MSSNRLIYDECAYKVNLNQSVGPYAYVLDPVRYENSNKCRMELGVIGGTSVSHIKGNLVDLETELRGGNRNASLCPAKHYMPPSLTNDNNYVQPCGILIEGTPNRTKSVINTKLAHLPSCQMIRYKPMVREPQINWETCPPRKYTGYVSCPKGQF